MKRGGLQNYIIRRLIYALLIAFGVVTITFILLRIGPSSPADKYLANMSARTQDPAKVIEYAPNEVRNLPGYQGADKGEPSNLGGFDATQIGGFYTKDGINHMVAQKTVVVPGQDGLFVIKLTADGTEDQAYPLMEATAAIDDQTTIIP